jgi:hypothetical protein
MLIIQLKKTFPLVSESSQATTPSEHSTLAVLSLFVASMLCSYVCDMTSFLPACESFRHSPSYVQRPSVSFPLEFFVASAQLVCMH